MELKTKIYESIGQASMCWDPIPSGIFDSTQAQKIGDELWNEIQKQRETIEKLREALSFYADEESWLVPTDENGVLTRGYSDTDIEGGDKARRVLEETK